MTHSAGPAKQAASAAAGQPVAPKDAMTRVVNSLGAANINKLSGIYHAKRFGRFVIAKAHKYQALSNLDDEVETSMRDYRERVQQKNLGPSTALWVWETFHAIDDWCKFQEKVRATIAGQLERIKDVELLKYTEHGTAAIGNCLNELDTLRAMNKRVATKSDQVWGFVAAHSESNTDVRAFVKAVENRDATTLCPRDLEEQVETLRATAEATLERSDALMSGMEQRLVKALEFEVIKAVKTAPSKVEGVIERAQKVAQQTGGGAKFVAAVGVPVGSAEKLLDSGKSLCDVFSHFVGRAITSYYNSKEVREDMKDPAKKRAALEFVNNQPLRVAEYLKEKYTKTLDGYIKLINLTQDVIMAAIKLAVEGVTHGAAAPVTKLVGNVIDTVTDIIKKAVRSFLLAVQDERIKAAQRLLENGQADRAARDSENFFKEYLKDAPGKIMEHISEEAQSSLLTLLTPSGLVAEAVSAFLHSVISKCLTLIKIEPAQIFTKETFDEALKLMSSEGWRHTTAQTAG